MRFTFRLVASSHPMLTLMVAPSVFHTPFTQLDMCWLCCNSLEESQIIFQGCGIILERGYQLVRHQHIALFTSTWVRNCTICRHCRHVTLGDTKEHTWFEKHIVYSPAKGLKPTKTRVTHWLLYTLPIYHLKKEEFYTGPSSKTDGSPSKHNYLPARLPLPSNLSNWRSNSFFTAQIFLPFLFTSLARLIWLVSKNAWAYL